ncbi:MAG: uroporphyrinogen decarboxylase family protein [Anaerolineae bacterium]|jgi:MtaA/CmuA family methyltransferase|nr:uroporphyrinogen decarboxylase family protein [Anaerolineae bacterium]MDH7473106.1 uroporphyrinogen decarboxylase family protein [Anaerolineae bacterium]
MNSYDRVLRRLRGETVDRPPNFDIMMTFAAHYIGQPLSRYYLDYRVLCEANLAVQQDFSLDIVQAISDPYREAADFGLEVEFPEDGLPFYKTPLLAEPADLNKLKPPDPSMGRRMSDRLAAVRYLREQVGGEVPIMGWVEGALAEAADLRGIMALMLDFHYRPEWLQDLLEICARVEIAFAQAQVEAGADIIGLGDAIASQVSPKLYRQFALPYEQRIFAAVHEMGALARLHICGNTTHILPLMVQSGADIIDLDWMVDIRSAAKTLGDYPVICGNFDPVAIMLQGTPEQVREATLCCLRWGGERNISGAGCEIPDGTPHQNLLAQAQALQEFGQSSKTSIRQV